MQLGAMAFGWLAGNALDEVLTHTSSMPREHPIRLIRPHEKRLIKNLETFESSVLQRLLELVLRHWPGLGPNGWACDCSGDGPERCVALCWPLD